MYVNRNSALILAALLFVSSMFVLQAHANPSILINVTNLVEGTPPPDDWKYMITDMNTLEADNFTLPAAGGGFFSSSWADPAGYPYSITQGGVTTTVTPIQGYYTSAEDFYGYNATELSGHAPYMETEISKIYLYEDLATGALSLIIHHNKHLGPANFWVNMSLTGLPIGADVLLVDDSTSGYFGLAGGGVAFGYWSGGNFSDGGILGGLDYPEPSWNITVQMIYTTGISAWEYQTASGPITLNMAEPLIISAGVSSTRMFSIAQHQKLNYDTTIIVNGTTGFFPTITENLTVKTLVSLGTNDTISVAFSNILIPQEMWGKQASPSDSFPPIKWTYTLPCRFPMPVQAAMRPDINGDGRIDLVKDKPTVILVNLSDVLAPPYANGPVGLNDQVTVSISDSQNHFNLQKLTTGQGIRDNNITIFYPNAPSVAENDDFICTVRYGLYQELLGSYTTGVTVKDTSVLSLYYAALDRPNDYGTEPEANYGVTVGTANDFINATYPLPKLTADTLYRKVAGNQYSGSTVGLLKDCQFLAQQAKLMFPNSVAVGIGVGPNVSAADTYKNYFAYHGAAGSKGKVAVGVSFGPGTRGVVYMDGYYTAAAHELAHTFNLYYGMPEQYLTESPGKTCNGFWAEKNTWRTGYDFMGLAPYKTTSITWVNTTSTYEYLFRNMTKVQNDPEILLANGIIYSNGTVEFPFNWYHLQDGTPDAVPPGNFALRFAASDGVTILGMTSFDAPFFMHIDPGIGLGEDLPDVTGFGKVNTDFAGFAFATAYPQGTAEVQVVNMTDQQGEPIVMATVNVGDIVNVGYYFHGFLPPINSDGSSIFKLGSTVPFKFQLTDFRGDFISTAIANIYLTKVNNNIMGTEIEAVSTSAATIGNMFRFDPSSNQYIFNLSTRTLSKGTWKIIVYLDDSKSKSVAMSLR